MIHLEYVNRAAVASDSSGCVHALRYANMCRGLPGRCHQTHRRRRRANGPEAALHCLQQLRPVLPIRRAEDERRIFELMMKCDMRYDRTSVGRNPMCAMVCPSRGFHYGTWEEIEAMRPRSVPQNQFRFGNQEVRTKVYMMVPRDVPSEYVDVDLC